MHDLSDWIRGTHPVHCGNGLPHDSQPLWLIMTTFRVTLADARETGGWLFGTRERAEAWCEQFGNTFTITEVDDDSA
jgi:hypothetical protein